MTACYSMWSRQSGPRDSGNRMRRMLSPHRHALRWRPGTLMECGCSCPQIEGGKPVALTEDELEFLRPAREEARARQIQYGPTQFVNPRD